MMAHWHLPSRPTLQEQMTLLTSLGWKRVATSSPWRWREPRTKALYTLRDAISLERSRSTKGNIGKPSRSIPHPPASSES